MATMKELRDRLVASVIDESNSPLKILGAAIGVVKAMAEADDLEMINIQKAHLKRLAKAADDAVNAEFAKIQAEISAKMKKK